MNLSNLAYVGKFTFNDYDYEVLQDKTLNTLNVFLRRGIVYCYSYNMHEIDKIFGDTLLEKAANAVIMYIKLRNASRENLGTAPVVQTYPPSLWNKLIIPITRVTVTEGGVNLNFDFLK